MDSFGLSGRPHHVGRELGGDVKSGVCSGDNGLAEFDRVQFDQAHLSWDSLLPFRLMSHGTRPVLENRSLLCDVLARVHALDTVVPRGHLPPR